MQDNSRLKRFTQNQENCSKKEDNKTSPRLPTVDQDFFSPKLQKWMVACEHLNGLRMVLEMGEWRAAIQIGFRALKTAPFDHYVWLEFFKILIKHARKRVSQS